MALKFNKINGTDIVIRNLQNEIKKIEGLSMEGLIKSAAIIRRDMDKTEPKIPVDTGNLRSSWFATPFYFRKSPAVRMGFTARYAIWVHEMVGANFNRTGSGAKFFESAINRNKDKILEIIRNTAKIK